MSFPARPHLSGLQPVPHGGAAQLRARGIEPERILDFSATVLPGGPPPALRDALAEVPLEAYPDPHCTALRAALSATHGLPADWFLPANGSVALIQAAARAALAPGDTAVVAGPTFGEYALAVQLAGARCVEVRAQEPGAIIEAIREHRARLVFLCSPNNPTGFRWPEPALRAIEQACFLILDEAYAGFLRPPPPPRAGPRRLVLRSLTKDRGLAGLRLGYAVGPPGVLAPLSVALTPWGVNALAQRAGVVALALAPAFEARIDRLWASRARLIEALEAGGWRLRIGAAPYFMAEVGSASAFAERCLVEGILLRDATSFGLPSWIRISPRGDADNARLIEVMERREGALG